MKKCYTIVVAIIIVFILLSCGRKVEMDQNEHLMVRIGDQEISIHEHIKRAEYTIRPPYCRSDNMTHRKIVLNSIIAEKLLALEAGDDNELMQLESFQNFIRGHKEQAMRQVLFQKVAYEKVELDTSEIKQVYKLAGRTYKVDFINVSDSSLASRIRADVQAGKGTFREVAADYFGTDKIPTREVSWQSPENPEVHNALFSQPLKKGKLIGLVISSDGSALLMHVADWINRPVITDKDIQQRWSDVKEKLMDKHAQQLYSQYIGQVMKGKKVDFDRGTFIKLTEALAPFYLKQQEQKQQLLQDNLRNQDLTRDLEMGNISDIKEQPLLNIDGQVWTVGDFLQEVRLHPLVFQKRKYSEKEFPAQFHLAILNLIEDKYLTREAYKKGYDKSKPVVNNTNMWQDHFGAMYQRDAYLKSLGIKLTGENYMQVIEEHLNPYIDSLQAKYGERIEVNTDAFDETKLTRVDLHVVLQGMPFPDVVPQFPLVTSDTKLDYGKKMEKLY
ncbi:MAG: hypothetical protein DWQ10_06875 [Calditrichaeota bacterium]|nr:MAG: hypothetical protein DWQ10_06875 [Calditrichota bacterium]